MLYEIQRQVGQLLNNNTQDLPSYSRSQSSADIRRRLNQVSDELKLLNRKLHKAPQNSITRDEHERRLRQVETLESRYIQLNKQFESSSATIASSIIRPMSSRLWEDDGGGSGDDDDDEEAAVDLTDVPAEKLYEDNQRLIQSQNASLDVLSQSIARNKQLALLISGEVEEQDEILGDIAIGIDQTNDRINNETRVITRLTEKDTTWGYWLVIICLLVAILVVFII